MTWEDTDLFSNDFTDTFGELTFNSKHLIDIRKQNSTARLHRGNYRKSGASIRAEPGIW